MYRGKPVNAKKHGTSFITGSKIVDTDQVYIFLKKLGGPFLSKCIEVHSDSVGQYTGLKDKKRTKEFPDGQPIYEGDQYYEGKNNDGRKLWTVKWAVAGFMGDYANGSGQRYINYEDIEIIGNIHQNEYLLKEKA